MFLVLMEQAVVSNENKARDNCNKARKRSFAALAEPEAEELEEISELVGSAPGVDVRVRSTCVRGTQRSAEPYVLIRECLLHTRCTAYSLT